MTRPTTCRDCGLAIRFVRTEAGKQMPIDDRPSRRGDVLVDLRDNGRVLTGHELIARRGESGLLYVRHHKTCPKRAGQLTIGGGA